MAKEDSACAVACHASGYAKLPGQQGLPALQARLEQPALPGRRAQPARPDLPGRQEQPVFPAPPAQPVRREQPAQPGRPARQEQPGPLLRQYMHNTEIAVTMRLSTILKTLKQPL